MAEDAEDRPGTDAAQNEVEFHYIKSNHFRVIHGDGVYGGVTPRGFIHLNFFSERAPIPQKITHEVTVSGQLGKEISAEGKEGIVREVEIGVVISLEQAQSLTKWLQEKIQLIETASKQQRQEEEKG